mmetsp:Transcript_138414/g.442333  ORF Transcript_138414/g.442333 Transcript_138414/m.442333 type:complete len:224 (-) Transcript_138414:75-746(-)
MACRHDLLRQRRPCCSSHPAPNKSHDRSLSPPREGGPRHPRRPLWARPTAWTFDRGRCRLRRLLRVLVHPVANVSRGGSCSRLRTHLARPSHKLGCQASLSTRLQQAPKYPEKRRQGCQWLRQVTRRWRGARRHLHSPSSQSRAARPTAPCPQGGPRPWQRGAATLPKKWMHPRPRDPRRWRRRARARGSPRSEPILRPAAQRASGGVSSAILGVSGRCASGS